MQSQPHRPHKAPMTAPTTGKKQRAYFMLSAVHSTWGMGRAEYMEKAVTKPHHSFFIYKTPLWNTGQPQITSATASAFAARRRFSSPKNSIYCRVSGW